MVILRDSSYADVEGLVRYIYRGEVDVEPDRLQSLLRTAELLKIKGLADQGRVLGGPLNGNQLESEIGEKLHSEMMNTKFSMHH